MALNYKRPHNLSPALVGFELLAAIVAALLFALLWIEAPRGSQEPHKDQQHPWAEEVIR